MIVYIFLLIGCLGAGLILKDDNKKNKIISVICTGIILILISSIRSINVGVDTLQYATVFEKIANCNSLTEAFNVSRFEKGFIVLCFILSRISSNPQILIFVSSVIIISSVMIFLYSSSKKVWLSLFMFIALNYFSMYMNVMRQAVAISIILIAFTLFLKKNKIILYLICTFFASLFHMSALIMLFMPIFMKIRFDKKLIPFLIVGILFFVFEKSIVSKIATLVGYEGYITKGNYFSSNYFGSLFLFLVSFVLFVFCYIYKNRMDKFNYSLLGICLISSFLSLCTIKVNVLGRLSEYTSIFFLLLIPNTIESLENPAYKKIVCLNLIIGLSLFWGIIAVFRPEWHGVIPYELFWEMV